MGLLSDVGLPRDLRFHIFFSHRIVSLNLALLLCLSSCTGVPPLVYGSRLRVAPSGPKVATLMANFKCELWDAVNSDAPLPFYEDGEHVIEHKDDPRRDPNKKPTESNRILSLRNIFEEIEYVADVQMTLDVSGSSALNPSIGFSKPYRAMLGVFPLTNALLSVGGNISDTGHRYIQINSSVDFSRLIDSPPVDHLNYKPTLANTAFFPCRSGLHKGLGLDLKGHLGMTETLASGIIAQSMNDIALFPNSSTGTKILPTGADAGKKSIDPPSMTGTLSNSINAAGQYTFGIISSQVDFTVVENINGGPTWTLKYFKGPGGNMAGLVNFNRQVQDKLLITFVPVCIRERYHLALPFPTPSDLTPRYEYQPQMVSGTPGWANYLPPCGGSRNLANQRAALAAARYQNDVNRLTSILPMSTGD